MAPRSVHSDKTAGFTLVEVLLSVALVGLLTLLLFGGLRFGASATNAAWATADRSTVIATSEDFLLAALQNIQAVPQSVAAAAAPIDFDGGPDQLDAMTMPPAYLAVGGLHWIHLGVVNGQTGKEFVVSWRLAARDAPLLARGALRPSVLAQKVRTVTFAYFGQVAGESASRWHRRWTGQSDLPRLIRIVIVFSNGARAPDVLVAPRQAHLVGAGMS